MDFQQWLGTGVPPVTVRGLDHRTEDHFRPPTTQGRNHYLLNSPEQDNPAVVANNCSHSRTRQGKILLSSGSYPQSLAAPPMF